jgi:hypothetical protein
MQSEGDARRAGLERARAILADLLEDTGDEGVAALLEQVGARM